MTDHDSIIRKSVIEPEISEILASEDKAAKIREVFHDMHPYDVFVLLEDLEDVQVAECVKALGFPDGIRVFEEFDDGRKQEIFECFSREWMADILEEMSPDERADLVKSLPEEKIEQVLPLVARAERIDIKKLITYEEGTAGSIMTTDYASLPPDITARDALEKIKLQAFDHKTIYYVYVIDQSRKLLGFVSLRQILAAPSRMPLEAIMHKHVISAQVNDDKEDVANKLSDYGFVSLPVIDEEERLVGIVTADDIIEVFEEETTEDIYKYGAAGEYIDYMKANIFNIAQQRSLWLLILIFVGFISSFVLQKNSAHLQEVVALSFFIPLLLGAGGNAGTQSSTVVIRGLATEDIKIEDVWQVIKKELSVGIMIGTFMALLGAILAWFMDRSFELGLTVGCAMVATVVLATSLGASLPIIFKRLNLDPALMSGPFITSIVDIFSLIIYFKIASVIFF
jgi:magnesium transporter